MNKPLFIFEMANNHGGSLEHGFKIISEIRKVCVYEEFDYAFKLQYRDLDTFIKEEYKNSGDKAVARFMSTKLAEEEFIKLKNEITRQGFISICTPFDEKSVERVVEHGYDYIKIASASFGDWPLIEKIAGYDKPVIASVAGSASDVIDNVAEFFAHRKINLSLMHCVGEYPTANENLQMNQITFLKDRYKGLRIGFSTHEKPDNFKAIMIAVAKGAAIFEKHVGIAADGISLNAYSATPEQVSHWLEAAREAYAICGQTEGRAPATEKEAQDLWNFKRGIFAKQDIKKGEYINSTNVYCAIPKQEGQLLSQNLAKYEEIQALEDIPADSAVCFDKVNITNVRGLIVEAFGKVQEMIKRSNVVVGKDAVYEFSHQYGIERFFEYGVVLIEIIKKAYGKKVLVLLSQQKLPSHMHKIKEESFQILYGSVDITVGGVTSTYEVGDIAHAMPGQFHSFATTEGCVLEEVSTQILENDSVYEDDYVNKNKKRKTRILGWDTV